MKVNCIKNRGYGYRLNIGKTYDVIEDGKYDYIIIDIDDKNDELLCPKYYFKSLAEIRIEKINKLLEE
jgi:hypothetical protein